MQPSPSLLRRATEYLERWNLRPDGEPSSPARTSGGAVDPTSGVASLPGAGALVIPVRRGSGERAVLKFALPNRTAEVPHLESGRKHHEAPQEHSEAAWEHTGTERQHAVIEWQHAVSEWEHLALRLWNGQGAVRLLAADPPQYVLLLERLDHTRPLQGEFIIDACEVIGSLFRALDRPAPPQIATITESSAEWHHLLAEPTPHVPRRLQDQARSVVVDLLASAPTARLVHANLHDANVLAPLGDRPGDGPAHAEHGQDGATGGPHAGEPRPGTVEGPGGQAWLAISPRPIAGEWAYAVASMVWARPEEIARAHNIRNHVRMRADIVADVAELDSERVRLWTFARLVTAAAAAPAQRDEARALLITLAKAFAS